MTEYHFHIYENKEQMDYEINLFAEYMTAFGYKVNRDLRNQKYWVEGEESVFFALTKDFSIDRVIGTVPDRVMFFCSELEFFTNYPDKYSLLIQRVSRKGGHYTFKYLKEAVEYFKEKENERARSI